MGAKDFKATFGLANGETSQSVITIPITSNSATTIDTAALNSFYSITYNVTITQGSKIRTSKILVQTDGTSVDSTEYGIVATGGAISGVTITATASAGNMLLQVTVTDAATTIARVRAVKNLLGVIQPYLPGAPTIGTATVATGQSYTGNANASVSFTAPTDNGNSAITSYTVTSSSGNSVSGASSPLTVSELVGIARTYTVTATNGIGSSTASSSSNSVTPSSVPQAPTIGTVTNTAGAVSIPFTPGATGGSAITSYTATSTSGVTATGASSPIALTETVDGTYTYTVTATNANGTSAASSASNSITITLIAKAGYYAGSSTVNVIDKFLFSNDSRSTISATISSNLLVWSAGFANSGTAGYVAGGAANNGGSKVATIDKLTFSDDSRSTLANGLSIAKWQLSAAANSGTAGYIAGGEGSGGAVNTIEKVTFSNDARTTLSANINNSTRLLAGMANSGTAGYFGGGFISGGDTTNIHKLLFSNETRSLLGTGLSVARQNLASFANSGTAGYFAGGFSTVVDKVTFSNDSRSTLATGLSTNRYNAPGFANSGVAGYVLGGYTTALTSTVEKFAFSDDSRTTLASGLSSAKQSGSAFANSGTL